MAYGTLSVIDELISQNAPLGTFGEDRAFDVINTALQIHNEMTDQMLAQLAEPTAARLTSFGSSASMKMQRVDEWGAVNVQKVKAGQQLSFPLYLFQVAIGQTRTFIKNATTREVAANFNAARDADLLNFQRELKRAIFTPTNNTGYTDALIDNAPLTLRALLNADGQEPPIGPNGETFNGGSHTHYSGSATLTAAALTALITNVQEHGVSGDLQLWIAAADEAAIRAMTGNFVAFTDPRITYNDQTTYANGNLDVFNVNNRAIGLFNAATVVVKPWMIANYQVAIDIDPQQRVLGLRTRDGGGLTAGGALGIAAEHDHHPLQADFMEREFGLSVWRRQKAAVLQSNNGTYTAPTIV